MPVLMCHGDADPVVKFSWAQQSKEYLEQMGKVSNVNWRVYRGMQHSACVEEVQEVQKFLAKLLA